MGRTRDPMREAQRRQEIMATCYTLRETRAAVHTAFESMRQINRRMLDIGVETGFITRRRVERQVVPIAALFDGLLLHAANGDADVRDLRRAAREVVSGMLGIVTSRV